MQRPDKARRVFQRQLGTRSSGRLDRACERELEIRCVRHTRIVAHRADHPKRQRTFFLGVRAPIRGSLPARPGPVGFFCRYRVIARYWCMPGTSAIRGRAHQAILGGDLKVTPELVERKRLRRMGKRVVDIAQLCGLSERTVKKVLRRPRQKIRNRNSRNRDGNRLERLTPAPRKLRTSTMRVGLVDAA